MDRIKSIDELYEEVKEYELVITNDAPLATALNARVDKPMVGLFAMTPRQIAAYRAHSILEKPLMSDFEVISSIHDDTEMSFKVIHSEVENIKEIMKYTSDVEKYLFSKTSKKVFESFRQLPTLERVMAEFEADKDDFLNDNKIAVIDIDNFNNQDKHFIHMDAKEIDLKKDGESFDIDTIYEIGNDRQIADNVVDLIPIEKSTDYALVIDTTSPLANAVKAALYRKGIPFINSMSVRDLSQIRDYLQFINCAMDFETLRVKHVKELFQNFNGYFKPRRDEFLLCRQTEDDFFKSKSDKGESSNGYVLWMTMRDIRDLTYMEVCERICNRTTKIQVEMILKELKLSDVKITSNGINEMMYLIDNVKDLRHSEEVPEYEKKGVLLVDCNNSEYIDRPVVFYLGMGQDWRKHFIGKRYVDWEDEAKKDERRLCGLLQQGSVRFYCVNTSKNGKKARPSSLFDMIYDEPIDVFPKICKKMVVGRWHDEPEEIIPEFGMFDIDGKNEFDKPFSKSSYNAYYSCPRNYMFKHLLKTPDNTSTEFGNLIHDFAEYYACYSDEVKEKGIEYYIDEVSEKYFGLSSPVLEDLDRDKIRKAMICIAEYLDDMGVKAPLDIEITDIEKCDNIIMKMEGKKWRSTICERDLESKKYPIHGKMDLILNDRIVDYKTGKTKSPKEIADSLIRDTDKRYPEFQPLIYLQLIREANASSADFDLFFALDDDLRTTPPQSKIRSVRVCKGDIWNAVIANGNMFSNPELPKQLRFNDKLIEKTDEILEAVCNSDADIEKLSENEGLVMEVLSIAGMNNVKTNREKVVEPTLRKISNLSKGEIFRAVSNVTVPEETLIKTMEAILDDHNKMVLESTRGYPATPRIKCTDCEFFSVCTKDVVTVEGENDDSE